MTYLEEHEPALVREIQDLAELSAIDASADALVANWERELRQLETVGLGETEPAREIRAWLEQQ
jgi:hypothetical protein